MTEEGEGRKDEALLTLNRELLHLLDARKSEVSGLENALQISVQGKHLQQTVLFAVFFVVSQLTKTLLLARQGDFDHGFGGNGFDHLFILEENGLVFFVVVADHDEDFLLLLHQKRVVRVAFVLTLEVGARLVLAQIELDFGNFLLELAHETLQLGNALFEQKRAEEVSVQLLGESAAANRLLQSQNGRKLGPERADEAVQLFPHLLKVGVFLLQIRVSFGAKRSEGLLTEIVEGLETGDDFGILVLGEELRLGLNLEDFGLGLRNRALGGLLQRSGPVSQLSEVFN